jgi:hypothetical protein
MEFEVVYWDIPGFGRCTRRDKEPLVRDENPAPLRVGTVLREGGAIGVVIARRKTLDGTDIHGHSVAVEILYSTLMDKYRMSKDLKYAVWSMGQCEVLKGETATAARTEPKMFVTALLEAEAKAEAETLAEWIKKHPVPEPVIATVIAPVRRPVGRTAITRTPVTAKVPTPESQLSVLEPPVVRTPVKRTPVVKEVDPIEAMRQKLSMIWKTK